jgi:hypothetical protein
MREDQLKRSRELQESRESKISTRLDPVTGKLYKSDYFGNFVGWVDTNAGRAPSDTQTFYETLDPVMKKRYDEVRKEVIDNPQVKAAAENLSTINQIEPKLEAARNGDTGQLASAINNAARAIGGEKGVMTDRDVLRASGLPAEWFNKTVDQVLTQIGMLDQTQQLATLEAMVNASKMVYNKQLQEANSGGISLARSKGLKVPDTESFLPVSSRPLSVTPRTIKKRHTDGYYYEKTDKGWRKTDQKWK